MYILTRYRKLQMLVKEKNMEPMKSSPLYHAHLAESHTTVGKRAHDPNWDELQAKRQRSNNPTCKRTTCSPPGKQSQQASENIGSESEPTPLSLAKEWTLPFTSESLELWLTPKFIDSLQLHGGLNVFCHAPSSPLITQRYLSELNSVLSDAKFRHDINFDRKSTFQPRRQGERAGKNFTHEQQYWEAMSIEFAIYARCRRLLSLHRIKPSWSPEAFVVPGISIPWRFPQMLRDLSDLVCMVVPESMGDLVHQRFDVQLIMQKIGRGIFKLNALVEWLGMLLQKSCAPHRDKEIQAAVATSAKAVSNEDIKGIVLSLKRFFYIIETMKLVGSLLCPSSN